MNIFFIFIIGILIFLILKNILNKNLTDNSSSNITETQRKWRNYRHSLDDHQSSFNKDDALLLYDQMILYINTYKRPFRILEWLSCFIDHRMIGIYCVNMTIILFISIGIPLLFGFSIVIEMAIFSVLFVDYCMYQRKLFLEVTEWNPEFRNKFIKNQ